MSETKLTLDQVPAPPEGAVFRLKKLDTVSIPHPYMITPRHVSWASDHWGGMLGKEAIRDAEKHGAECGICRDKQHRDGSRILSIDEHESSLTLFIVVPQNRDLNSVTGLHAYLLKLKEANLGIEGFAFPTS